MSFLDLDLIGEDKEPKPKQMAWPLFSKSIVRALSSGVLNVLNAIIFGIWHVKLQNMSFIRCSICVIFLEHATVRFHI